MIYYRKTLFGSGPKLTAVQFIVLIPDLGEDLEHAMHALSMVADKLHLSIAEPVDLNGITHSATASIGITLFSHKTQSANELMKEADLALYQAKASGRNTIRFFDDAMHTQFTEKTNLETSLRSALGKNEFNLMYQPQVDQSGRIIGAEALLRWEPFEMEIISPEVFIPIAEESGLIFSIGEWALQNACTQLLAWSKNPFTQELVLSVNISAKQFRRPNFAQMVGELIDTAGINPQLLKFELTESLLLENVDEVISTINDLRKIGVKFSIDDFGTGYSSLSYLKKLPLDEIKIDKSFVLDIA